MIAMRTMREQAVVIFSGVISRIFRSSQSDPFWMYQRSCWMRSAIFSGVSIRRSRTHYDSNAARGTPD
jgi:hypothetical protein